MKLNKLLKYDIYTSYIEFNISYKQYIKLLYISKHS